MSVPRRQGQWSQVLVVPWRSSPDGRSDKTRSYTACLKVTSQFAMRRRVRRHSVRSLTRSEERNDAYQRPGDNLCTTSVIALDVATGALKGSVRILAPSLVWTSARRRFATHEAVCSAQQVFERLASHA